MLLRNYLDQRILFYVTRDDRQLLEVNAPIAQLQSDLWFMAQAPASAHPTPVIALAVSGMNDVLNSQGTSIRLGKPHSTSGMVFDGGDYNLLPSVGRLRCTPIRIESNSVHSSAVCCLYFILSHSGYRQSASRRHPSASSKSGNPPQSLHAN